MIESRKPVGRKPIHRVSGDFRFSQANQPQYVTRLKAKWAAPVTAAFLVLISTFVLAEPSELRQSNIDLSGLSGEDQGQANVIACLVECNRDGTLDARYERVRYDHYYETESGFVLSDPTDPDSEVVSCTEITCEPPPRASAIRSICLARIGRFENYANCAQKCTLVGRIYSETLFDDEPFSTYIRNATNNIVSLCERVNNSPFTDYDSTCPEISFDDGEAIDCTALSDILEDEADISAQNRKMNLDERTTPTKSQ